MVARNHVSRVPASSEILEYGVHCSLADTEPKESSRRFGVQCCVQSDSYSVQRTEPSFITALHHVHIEVKAVALRFEGGHSATTHTDFVKLKLNLVPSSHIEGDGGAPTTGGGASPQPRDSQERSITTFV
ncbi:hypothetical protein EVAR_24528_1 [Eumeta japonica]|uniref:Uncharacterized protein n=1 Tax=Eumeta variegata TaxID=151549 RepID=A0A4C1US98_EUMVA|nr:hypothetical protein EVAR_24528_1 [Eumeta japonica]